MIQTSCARYKQLLLVSDGMPSAVSSKFRGLSYIGAVPAAGLTDRDHMKILLRKLRRYWTVYVAWRRWGGMHGRTVAGIAGAHTMQVSPEKTESVWQQTLDFTSEAPRVFADRDALLSFLRVLDEASGYHGLRLDAAREGVSADEAVDTILEIPADQITQINVSAGSFPQIQVMLNSSPGWDENSARDPRDNLSEVSMPGIQGTYCVRVHGMKILSGPNQGGGISSVVYSLRQFTEDPSKKQLRRLKGNFPLINIDSRDKVRDQQFQSKVQKKAGWISAAVALTVGVGIEIVKAFFGQ